MSKPNRHEMWQLQQMQALPLDIKIFKSQLRIREWVDYYGSDGVYVSFSGGKDSTVLLDLVRGLYPDVVAVFADTGLEFPEIRDFVKNIPNVDWVKPKLMFKEVIDKCGYPVISKEQAEWLYRGSRSNNKEICRKHFFGIMPDGSQTKYRLSKKWRYLVNAPFKIGSGCCKELKKNPIAKYAKETNRVPIVGTMAGESMLRTQKWLQQGCNAFDNKLPQSAPLSFWSEEDIWEYIRLKQLPYCKIYDMGYSRTGCVFCMFGAHLEKEPNRFQRLGITHPKLLTYCLKPKCQGGLGMRKVLDFINVPYKEGEKYMEKRIYTAESVTSGHPDKLADLIADSILDECLEQDENSHVACEVMLSHNKAFISGEITTKADIDIEYIVRSLIAQVGYDPTNIEVETRIHRQSNDIAAAVGQNENEEKRSQGAGDQGIVYGYATEETLNFMPLPLELAHRLTNRLEECHRQNLIDDLLPDGKSQVSIEYINDRFSKITSIIVSAQHRADKDFEQLTTEIKEKVIDKVFEEYDLSAAEVLVNPSGRFVLGGFEADTGLTGRKLMVDSYGGIAHHGGGAFSGKDASKVDRSGAYMARYIAKNIVAAGLAEKCEVALSYAIGKPTPTSVDINTIYTGAVSENLIVKAVEKVFDLSVAGMIEKLDLKQPVFAQTAVGGHFGKDYFAWEQTDKAEELKDAILQG